MDSFAPLDQEVSCLPRASKPQLQLRQLTRRAPPGTHCNTHDPARRRESAKKCERLTQAAHVKLEGNPQNSRARQPPHALSRLAFAESSLKRLSVEDPAGLHQLTAEILSIQESSLRKVVADSSTSDLRRCLCMGEPVCQSFP